MREKGTEKEEREREIHVCIFRPLVSSLSLCSLPLLIFYSLGNHNYKQNLTNLESDSCYFMHCSYCCGYSRAVSFQIKVRLNLLVFRNLPGGLYKLY